MDSGNYENARRLRSGRVLNGAYTDKSADEPSRVGLQTRNTSAASEANILRASENTIQEKAPKMKRQSSGLAKETKTEATARFTQKNKPEQSNAAKKCRRRSSRSRSTSKTMKSTGSNVSQTSVIVGGLVTIADVDSQMKENVQKKNQRQLTLPPKQKADVKETVRGSAPSLLDEELMKVIFRNLRIRESAYEISGPLRGLVTPRMWSILIDWMIEVQVNFKLSPNCLFLAVNVLSRFFRLHAVDRADLQLAGAAALVIASKHEEVHQHEIADYVYICADTYTRAEIIHMESLMLRTLDYRLCVPLASNFVMRYARTMEPEEVCFAMFLLEMTLQNFRFSWLPSSLVATSAILLTGFALKKKLWTREMSEETGYSNALIYQCSFLMHEHLVHEYEYESILVTCREKYQNPRYYGVSREGHVAVLFTEDALSRGPCEDDADDQWMWDALPMPMSMHRTA